MTAKKTVWFMLALGLFAGCTTTRDNSVALQRFEFAQAQMGLEFRITLYAENEATATHAVSEAFARISQLNSVLSDYDSDSELSQLSFSSGSTQWVTVSDDLWTILKRSQSLSEQSDGAFDLTIGPSVNLWRRSRRRGELPSDELLAAMHKRVGHQFLNLDDASQSAKLTKPNMRLDAGGIAKGFAMDEALAVLREQDISSAMIHGGGDMVFGHPPPGREGWTVQLAAPGTDTLLLSNAALATSGDLVQFLEIDGVRYSHIIDPRTGVGLTNRSLVHVIAPDGITADSLSTTLNILGNDDAKQLLEHYRNVHARITSVINEERKTTETPQFGDFVVRP